MDAPRRHDVAEDAGRSLRLGPALGEDGGEGELGGLVAEVTDFLALFGDGLATRSQAQK